MFGKQWLFRTAQRTGMSQGVREKMDLLAEGRWSGQSHVLISVYDTAFWFALYLLFPHLWIWLMCNTMHISRGCRVVISSSHRVNSCHNISTPKKDSKNKKQQQQEKKNLSGQQKLWIVSKLDLRNAFSTCFSSFLHMMKGCGFLRRIIYKMAIVLAALKVPACRILGGASVNDLIGNRSVP